jgi:MYXO-CTERM domain-containing protein
MSFPGFFSGATRTRSFGLVLGAALLGAAYGPPASAAVTEPNGLAVPQPVTAAETNIATSRGFTAPALTLQGLFANQCFGDPIDPIADAETEPAAFSPLCGFTGTLVMRGGGCRLALGWYNANQSGQTPTDAEIYTLVPASPATARDFCPLAAVHTNDPNRADTAMITAECNSCPLGRGTGVITFSADDIRMLPEYQGGLIGFALRGDAATQCPQTHFSENDLNPDCTTGCVTPGPWIMTLVYTSKTYPDTFYLAFEDLPATTFGPNMGMNDGDFNDFVYQITGVTCDGGGQPCQVADRLGACAGGVTACAAGGTLICTGGLEPTPEQCDNVDNNCDGMVDNDPTLCTADNKVCYQGKCVPHCGTGEFQCGVGETCVDGLCVDVPCQGVTCAAEEVCRGGVCVGACTGVVCPLTTNGRPECRLGRCADPCVSAGCDALGLICEKGSCVRNCECRACPAGTACSPTGQCTDTACATMQCPAGEICFEGQCQDPCTNAVCPGGAMCAGGVCGPPGTSGTGAGGSSTSGTGGVIIAGTSNGATTGFGGSSAASGGGGGDDGELGATPTGNPGCACRITGAKDASGLMTLLAAALAGALGVRRRRQRA